MDEQALARRPVEPPQWSGFRLNEGGRWLTVIYCATSTDSAGIYWGEMFSDLAPSGVQRQLPHTSILFGFDEQIARQALESIRHGTPVSPEILHRLPEYPDGAQWVDFKPLPPST